MFGTVDWVLNIRRAHLLCSFEMFVYKLDSNIIVDRFYNYSVILC